MFGWHAWAGRATSGNGHVFKGRDWLSALWDPVLYVIVALLCAILAIDAFVLVHTF